MGRHPDPLTLLSDHGWTHEALTLAILNAEVPLKPVPRQVLRVLKADFDRDRGKYMRMASPSLTVEVHDNDRVMAVFSEGLEP